MDSVVILLTLKLAVFTTLILLMVGIPLALFLSEKGKLWKTGVEALVSLPLVLPPSVIGYYLLVTFSPGCAIGKFLENHWNVNLVFTFEGMVLASVIFSLPFMVQPIKSALQGIAPHLKEASYSLGKTKFQTLIYVLLPNIKSSILAACVLTFAHTLGEFGVIMMIGGNIPGKTRVASLAIYDEVEAMNYHSANLYSLGMVFFSFVALFVLYFSHRKVSALIYD